MVLLTPSKLLIADEKKGGTGLGWTHPPALWSLEDAGKSDSVACPPSPLHVVQNHSVCCPSSMYFIRSRFSYTPADRKNSQMNEWNHPVSLSKYEACPHGLSTPNPAQTHSGTILVYPKVSTTAGFHPIESVGLEGGNTCAR